MSVTRNGSHVNPNTKESRQLKVTLTATDKHPYIKGGTQFTVHPSQEANLITKGFVEGGEVKKKEKANA